MAVSYRFGSNGAWMKSTKAMVLMLVLLGGCRAAPGQDHALLMQRTELFFGLSVPDGGQISEQAWQTFVDETISPRFPDGFTVIDGVGQWRESSGKIARERSKILLVLHPRDAQALRKL